MLEVLVMPNKEVLYLGKTLGFIGDGEKSIQEKHLKNSFAIEIPFSESDLEELQSGETFNWTFPTKEGLDVHVHLRPANEDGE